ncbi:uncharacterized protein N7477_005441 [Penicillium maclennaniae]|uniref:uncharacterized protein n=1 Tax=Penicillium maclennaniae TaxID=1343394 RepID=UPI0025400CA1|nr:uncharacterized protein N7477_005441 [Penicillium maclennaniae]KAJ5670078.1 hypothetical protein N7477_005441 [Penicillium maclennaniae]
MAAVTPTYHQNNAILQELRRLRRGDHESTIYGIWNSILSLQFPITQGYVTRPQDRHTDQAGKKGFSDLHVFHYRGAASTATKFLIVQCKRIGDEGKKSVWKQAIGQLNRYLGATHGRRPRANRTAVYGIAGIGKEMRVFKYDDVKQRVFEWAPHGWLRGSKFHLENNRVKVQQILDAILNDH